MEITMYELIGLVKDGKAPKKIKFRNEIYEYEEHIKDSFIDYVGIEKETNEVFYLSSYIGDNYISDIFTGEVEIIEEPKKIEKIARCDDVKMTHYGELYKPTENEEILRIKINELMDEINKLKEND